VIQFLQKKISSTLKTCDISDINRYNHILLSQGYGSMFDGFVKSPSAALRFIPCPVKLKAAILKDMGYRRCLKIVTSNKENI
jgi:hypothetical protein